MINECHFVDDKGRPAGGETWGVGVQIEWQNGPVERTVIDGAEYPKPNGAQVEDVIEAAIGRLAWFQTQMFANQYNADAIDCLREALDILHARTADRVRRGVEGRHED